MDRVGGEIPRHTSAAPNFVVLEWAGEPWVHVMPPIAANGEFLMGAVSALRCPEDGAPSVLHFSESLFRVPTDSAGFLVRQIGGVSVPWPHWGFQVRHYGNWVAVRTEQNLWIVRPNSTDFLGVIPDDEGKAAVAVKKMNRKIAKTRARRQRAPTDR